MAWNGSSIEPRFLEAISIVTCAWRENNMEKEYIIIKESLLKSIAKDCVTFGFLLLCIYVSVGSTWWTFLTGCLFLLFFAAKITLASENARRFKSKQAAIEYLSKEE